MSSLIFSEEQRRKYLRMSSAAVVIGALWVKTNSPEFNIKRVCKLIGFSLASN